jgi:class 3 adenylate cyclase/tetratricopeptide (TPR) repeat protein
VDDATRCPRCQRQNDGTAVFCGGCGARLPRTCPRCRRANASDNSFCQYCGAFLGSEGADTTLGGERKALTVLFADLKNSMMLLADEDPEEARRILDPVLERMIEAVHRFGGTVNQVMGDGIMALFGAPRAYEDHAVRGCLAALRMQEAVKAHARDVASSLRHQLAIRVGLNSGEVVVRAIGGDLRVDYTAIGETTHLAARMEQLASPGSILITGTTYALAQEFLEVRELGPTMVKGLERPVDVFEVVGARQVHGGEPLGVRRAVAELVGRTTELAALNAALEHAAAGRGQVVAIAGEAGIGKSRLVAEFLEREPASGWVRVGASWLSYEAGWDLPLADMIRRLIGADPGDPAARVRDKAAEKARALGEGLVEHLQALLQLLDVLPPEDAMRALDPAEARRRFPLVVEALLGEESRRTPLIVVFENLQWGDLVTQAALERLAARLAGKRLLVVLTYRPGGRPPWADAADVREIRLAPLAPDDARAMLAALLGPDAGLAPLIASLTERSGRNPLFLEECVRHVVERKVVEGRPGDYRLVRGTDLGAVPATVHALLLARIDRLPTEDKALLQALAAIGTSAPLGLIERVAATSGEALADALARLEQGGFLCPTGLVPDVEHAFTQGLTRDVAYSTLLREQRRALHDRVLRAMEALYADRLAAHVDRLAQHASEARAWDKALTYHRQAGERAVRRAANLEALDHFEKALEAVDALPPSRALVEQGIDLRMAMRVPLLQMGRLEDALARSREAERLAQDLGDERTLARVYTYLVNHHYLHGDPATALGYGQRCLQIAVTYADVGLAAMARQYMAQSHHVRGEYAQARALLEENVETLAKTVDLEPGGPLGLNFVASSGWLAFTLAALGELDLADAAAGKGCAVAARSRHPYASVIASTMSGLVQVEAGRLEEAMSSLYRSLQESRQPQVAVWQPIPSALLGLALARAGLTAAGLPLLRAAVARSGELGVSAYLARWTACLVEGLLLDGRLAEAGEAADRALALAREHQERGHEAIVLHLAGSIAAAMPAGAGEAAARFREALALARELQMRPLVERIERDLERLGGPRPTAEERPARPLVVVARWNRDLYAFLCGTGDAATAGRVILDRRVAERRRGGAPAAREQRTGERRRIDGVDLEHHGVLLAAGAGPDRRSPAA